MTVRDPQGVDTTARRRYAGRAMRLPRRTGLSFLIAVLLTIGASSAAALRPSEVRVRVGKSVDVSLPNCPKDLTTRDANIATVKILADGAHVRVEGLAKGVTRIVGTGVDIPVHVVD